MGPIALIFTVVFGLVLYGMIVAFSPTLVVTELAILTRSKKPFIDSIFFIAGILVPVFLYATIAIVFANADKSIHLPSSRVIFGSIPLVDILAGILLIWAGIRVQSRPQSVTASEKPVAKPDALPSTKALFWFGLIKMGTSLSSIAAIILGASFIQSFITEGIFQAVALIWFIVISVLPFVFIASLKSYFPNVFKRIQTSSDRIARYNWMRILRWVFFVSGAYLIWFGIVNISQVG